jgi:glucose/mannose-6-phosphate isomerase
MSTASDLDDATAYELDRDGMFEHIRNVGDQLIGAWERSATVSLPPLSDGISAVVVAGIGGSATAGDYFAAIAAPVAPIPVQVVQGYELPAWVSPSTLVVACSYSGNTPETLAAYAMARSRGAQITVITGGGTLAEQAARDGVPVLPIEYRASPRATTAHTLAPLLRIGANLGLVDISEAVIHNAAAAHRDLVETQLVPGVKREGNQAKEIASSMVGRNPIVLGGGHLEPAVVRFKNQLAENGKALATADFVPQAGHNLVVGLATANQRPDEYAVIALGSRLFSRELTLRALAISSEFEAAGIRSHGILVDGGSILGDLLQATAWGDYVSCYLALLNREDPTPVPQIDRVRAYGS